MISAMPAPFFASTASLGTLSAVAATWVGTPFRANSEDRGRQGGVCCHLLVWHVLVECGMAIQRPPFGPAGHARYSRESIMQPWLDASPHFERIPYGASPGDVLGFRLGGAIHHLALVLPGEAGMLHTLNGIGVMNTPVADATWSARHAATWRPVSV